MKKLKRKGNKKLKTNTLLVKSEQTQNFQISQLTSHSSGITLIALVVTIVVLLILAGITINFVLADGGIFKSAQDAKNTWEQAVQNDLDSINSLTDEMEYIINA